MSPQHVSRLVLTAAGLLFSAGLALAEAQRFTVPSTELDPAMKLVPAVRR